MGRRRIVWCDENGKYYTESAGEEEKKEGDTKNKGARPIGAATEHGWCKPQSKALDVRHLVNCDEPVLLVGVEICLAGLVVAAEQTAVRNLFAVAAGPPAATSPERKRERDRNIQTMRQRQEIQETDR